MPPHRPVQVTEERLAKRPRTHGDSPTPSRTEVPSATEMANSSEEERQKASQPRRRRQLPQKEQPELRLEQRVPSQPHKQQELEQTRPPEVQEVEVPSATEMASSDEETRRFPVRAATPGSA